MSEGDLEREDATLGFQRAAPSEVRFMRSWADLTRTVLNAAPGLNIDDDEFHAFAAEMRWGFDTWIQAALNGFTNAGGSIEELTAILETALYSDLRRLATSSGTGRISPRRVASSRAYASVGSVLLRRT